MQLSPPLTRDLQAIIGEIFSVTAVSGGITNQNYKLETATDAFMLRLAGEKTELLGIDRSAEFTCSSLAFAAGVGAEPLVFFKPHQAMLTRFIKNAETLSTERAKLLLEPIVTALKKVHTMPALPKDFSPFATVRQYHQIALQHGVSFSQDTARILEQLTQIENILLPDVITTPCHNDLLPANLLSTGQLWIVDWEYAGNGNCLFDLANLAANLELNALQMQLLLELYFGEIKLERQLQLMRIVSDAREAFWGFLQSGVSSLDFDFRQYAKLHLERVRKGLARVSLSSH